MHINEPLHTPALREYNAAVLLAEQLNADPDDDWTYSVERIGPSLAHIRICDADGALVGHL
jgi:hypothetical protein